MNNLGGLGAQLAIKRKPKGPCPSCGLKVDEEKDKCPHCGYKLTPADKDRLRLYLEFQRKKGQKLAMLVFPVFIIVMFIVFSLK
jgi:uncharacterized membrane protein YvbJ